MCVDMCEIFVYHICIIIYFLTFICVCMRVCVCVCVCVCAF
jgi:hypothetical protein